MVPGTKGVLALHKSSVRFAMLDKTKAERNDAHIRTTAAIDLDCTLLFMRLIVSN